MILKTKPRQPTKDIPKRFELKLTPHQQRELNRQWEKRPWSKEGPQGTMISAWAGIVMEPKVFAKVINVVFISPRLFNVVEAAIKLTETAAE